MNKPNRCAPELRERAARMVLEHKHEDPSPWAALQSVAEKIGCFHSRSEGQTLAAVLN